MHIGTAKVSLSKIQFSVICEANAILLDWTFQLLESLSDTVCGCVCGAWIAMEFWHFRSLFARNEFHHFIWWFQPLINQILIALRSTKLPPLLSSPDLASRLRLDVLYSIARTYTGQFTRTKHSSERMQFGAWQRSMPVIQLPDKQMLSISRVTLNHLYPSCMLAQCFLLFSRYVFAAYTRASRTYER